MKDHVIFGVSPFNTKFSEEYIFNMLDWGFENFIRVDVIHPHEDAKYLLMGCGNDEVKSKKKSRKEYARVINIIDKYISNTGNKLSHGQVMKFSDFYHLDSYNYLYALAKDEYESHAPFREICISQTEKALLSRKKAIGDDSPHDDEHTRIATEYILREIPFIVSPAEVLSSDGHVYISYYADWSVADYLYNHGVNIKPSQRTGLIIKDHAQMEMA